MMVEASGEIPTTDIEFSPAGLEEVVQALIAKTKVANTMNLAIQSGMSTAEQTAAERLRQEAEVEAHVLDLIAPWPDRSREWLDVIRDAAQTPAQG